MRIHSLGGCGWGRAKWFLVIALAMCGLAGAAARAAATEGGVLDPPNSAAIFEQARIAERRVLFGQDFEGPVAEDYLRIWYDCRDQVARCGKQSTILFRMLVGSQNVRRQIDVRLCVGEGRPKGNRRPGARMEYQQYTFTTW